MSYEVRDWEKVHDWRDRRFATTMLTFHTNGSAIVCEALDKGRDPNLYVPDHYDEPGADGPHELITWDNEAVMAILKRPVPPTPDSWRLARPEDACPHAGIGPEGLRVYREGLAEWTHWEKLPGKELVRYQDRLSRYDAWIAKWPDRSSPLSLLPANCDNPNDCSYSFEMVQPVERKPGGGYRTLPFTRRMHDVAAFRAAHLLPQLGIPRESRVDACVGHEDLHPICRFDASGGWDPGGLGKRKLWDWALFHARLDYWLQAPPVDPASGPAPAP